MITLNKHSNMANTAFLELYGLSTDSKPTKTYEGIGIANGSKFVEMDTSKSYYYSTETEQWFEFMVTVSGGSNSDILSNLDVASTVEIKEYLNIEEA